MRVLLVGIFFLVALPVRAQTGIGDERDTSRSELEHQQLRDLLASQSAELQATREQLRQLQQRMELLEIQRIKKANPIPSKNRIFPTRARGCAQPS